MKAYPEVRRVVTAHDAAGTPDRFDEKLGIPPPPRHPFIHRTRMVDYVIVFSGEIDIEPLA